MQRLVKWLTVVGVMVLLIAIALVAPIDRTPLRQQAFYPTMMQRLDTLRLEQTTGDQLLVGWQRLPLVPDHPIPMAGYRPRPDFTGVNDSLHVGITCISNGAQNVFLISADLLLFPPVLKDMITEKVRSKNYFLYFSASHTHSSVGGWDPSVLGRILMGPYEEQWMAQITTRIVGGMEDALKSARPSTLSYLERDASWYVYNRLDRKAPEDGWLRGLQITRDDSSSAIIAVFGAHPTLIASNKTLLSGDYPGALVAHLERVVNYAQFLGGMMGSHRLEGMKRSDYDFAGRVGELLAEKALEGNPSLVEDASHFVLGHVQVAFGSSQMRLMGSLKLRNWVFNQAVGPLEGDIAVLRIGNVLLLGMPCDFSGEIATRAKLHQLAAENGLHLIITSFNGDYAGYVTADDHYDRSKNEEVRALNWVGPYFGDYFAEILKKLIKKAAEDKE